MRGFQPTAPERLRDLCGAMRDADDFCGEWDLELPAEDLHDLLQPSSASVAGSVLALHVQFGDASAAALMDEETALQELARAADEIYDSDPAFDADDLHAFSAPLDWVRHASPQQQPQPQHAAHGALTLNGNGLDRGGSGGPLAAAPAPAAATSSGLNATHTEQLSSVTAPAILPLIQSRVTAQALATDSVTTPAGYVAPHVQYLLNRAAAQVAAGVSTTPRATIAMQGMMHPVLVGVEEMNTLYSKISSANAAQNEQRRNNRLARNRASARLRRRKKKTVVETLESAATTLEQQLQCLREHDYSTSLTDDVLNALEIDTAGELDARQPAWDTRMDLLQQLFDNLREHANMLSDVLLAAEASEQDTDVAEVQELMRVLNLRPEQVEQIKTLGLDEARERAQHLRPQIEQLRQIQLDGSQVQTFTEELRSLFSANQLSKLTTWLELNKEVVEALDPLKERSDHDRRGMQEEISFMFDFSDRNIRPTANATA